MPSFRRRLITAGVNVSPHRFSRRFDSMAVRPFTVLQSRFQDLAPRERYQSQSEFICSPHCSQQCLVVLCVPNLSDSLRRYIPNPPANHSGLVALAVCHFAPRFLSWPPTSPTRHLRLAACPTRFLSPTAEYLAGS